MIPEDHALKFGRVRFARGAAAAFSYSHIYLPDSKIRLCTAKAKSLMVLRPSEIITPEYINPGSSSTVALLILFPDFDSPTEEMKIANEVLQLVQ